MNEIKIGSQSIPSILNNPFSKNMVTNVSVNYRKGRFSGKWSATGWVEFKNGKTEGRQDFEGENFDDVATQIREFIKTL